MVDLTTPGGQHVSVPVNLILYSTEDEDPDCPRGPWVNMEETETPIAAYDGELAQLPPGPDRQQINTPYNFQFHFNEVVTPLAQGTATPLTQNIIGNRDVTHVITSFTAGLTL